MMQRQTSRDLFKYNHWVFMDVSFLLAQLPSSVRSFIVFLSFRPSIVLPLGLTYCPPIDLHLGLTLHPWLSFCPQAAWPCWLIILGWFVTLGSCHLQADIFVCYQPWGLIIAGLTCQLCFLLLDFWHTIWTRKTYPPINTIMGRHLFADKAIISFDRSTHWLLWYSSGCLQKAQLPIDYRRSCWCVVGFFFLATFLKDHL